MNSRSKKTLIDKMENFYHTLREDEKVRFSAPDNGINNIISEHCGDFLRKELVLENNTLFQFSEEVIEFFSETIKIIKNNKELKAFADYCHLRIYQDYSLDESKISPVERLKSLLGRHSGMFPAVLLISAIEGTVIYYKLNGIKDEILKDTISAVKGFMQDYKNNYGEWGLEEFDWLTYFIKCRIFKIGRLQFFPKYYEGNVVVFRNILNGRVCALSRSEIKYRKDGYVDGTNGIFSISESFNSIYEENEHIAEGIQILPSGIAVNKIVKLLKEEWKKVFTERDLYLEVHIPGGTELSHENCGDSFKAAISFFERLYPEFSFDAFVCSSWLLDPQMQKLLSTESNIVKFQREFYLYPIFSDDKQTFENLFGVRHTDINKVTCKTSLQKAVADYVKKGNRMSMGGMFFLKDEVQRWGSEYYQKD